MLFFANSCIGINKVEAVDPWARSGVAGQNTAIYFVINNPTDAVDTLLSASTDAARGVELHISMKVEPEDMDSEGIEGDVMRMVPQESIEIPANSSVSLQPGGLHVMLIDLQQDLNEGESLELTLLFERAGEITLTVPVEMR